MSGKIAERILRRLESYADRPWYLPLAASFAAADLFILVIPTEAILVSTVLLRPKRWGIAVGAMTLGSAIGATALAAIVRALGEPVIEQLFGESMKSESWIRTMRFLEQHGNGALALVSISPLPQQPAVVLCALAHMSTAAIFGGVLLGRGLKYLGFGWAATHAPKLFSSVLRSSEAREAMEKHTKSDS